MASLNITETGQFFCKPFLPNLDVYLDNSSIYSAVPLWSTRSILNNEYLQIEVLDNTQEVSLEKSTDDILNMNKYKCHICNINVPKSNIHEHNNSVKHKTCIKIADVALERMRQQMKLDIKESRVKVADTYFCEPCAVIVQKVNKIIHENSENHFKSLKHDKLLKEFLMIYEDVDAVEFVTIENGIISDEKESMSSEMTGTAEAYDFPLEDNDIDINIPCHSKTNICKEVSDTEDLIESETNFEASNEVTTNKDPTDFIKQETDKITEQNQQDLDKLSDMSKRMVEQLSECLTKYFPEKLANSMTKAEKKENSQKASAELVNYLKTMTDKCDTEPIHTVEALTDKLILITAINGDKIKVSVNNFHSFHNQKDKNFCKICEDPNVGFWHERSEEHMSKAMIPIEDKHGIRKLDDIWSHCVLCNDLTKNITFHLQSLIHKNKLKQCFIEDTDLNENIVQKSNADADTTQLILEHSLIVSHDNSEILCNICDITINNRVKSIKEHIKTFEHITNYDATIERNRLNEIDDAQYYCVPCDVCVARCYALGHCNGKKHNKHLTDLLKNENVEIVECTQIILPSISQQIKRHKNFKATDSDLICFVCNVVLYCVNEHMNSLEHKKSYFAYLEANKLNEIEEDTFYCIPCNTVILIDYLMNHCTSKKHKDLLKEFMNNAESVQNNPTQHTGQLIAENTHISRSIKKRQNAQQSTSNAEPSLQNVIFDTAIPLKFLYQFREMSNARNLLCTICDEEVPYRKYEVQNHVNAIDHIVAFNLMMLWNKIKRMNDKYFCGVCKVDITYFSELSHVTSSHHIEVMAKQPKGTVYEYDRSLLTLDHAISHKVGDRVRPSSLISVGKTKSV